MRRPPMCCELFELSDSPHLARDPCGYDSQAVRVIVTSGRRTSIQREAQGYRTYQCPATDTTTPPGSAPRYGCRTRRYPSSALNAKCGRLESVSSAPPNPWRPRLLSESESGLAAPALKVWCSMLTPAPTYGRIEM